MNIDSLFAALAEWGLAGMVLAISGWYIFRRDQNHETVMREMRNVHKEERDTLMGTISRQHTEAMNMQRDTNVILSSLTVAVTELSTLFRDRK